MFVTMKFLKNYIIKISGAKIDSENLNKKMSAKNNPSLAEEWHSTLNIPLTPNNVTSGSDRKVWWKYNQYGHDWEAFIYNRNQGRGCPKCK